MPTTMRSPTPLGRFAKTVLTIDLVAVTVAGIQLFVLAEETADYFAWTIKAPITAAFLGAGYWASVPSVVLALRTREWQNARILLVMGVVLTCFAALATFLHLELFHLDSGPWEARAAAWTWVAIYIAIPILLIAAIVVQERAGGRDEYAIREPLQPWVRAVLVAHAVPLTILGAGLAFLPGTFSDMWPWALTPLTAGAVAGWLLTVATACWWALREGDWRRVRIAFPALILFDLLALAAAVRYADALDDGAATWVYIGWLVASACTLGVAALRNERAERVPA
jgi:hypothetical protein